MWHSGSLCYSGKGWQNFFSPSNFAFEKFFWEKALCEIRKVFSKDLDWWKSFASWFNGEARFIRAHDGTSKVFATDSSNYGYGGYHGHDWFAGGWYSAAVVELDDHAHCVGTAVQYKD